MPNEACGLIGGVRSVGQSSDERSTDPFGDIWEARSVIPVKNAKMSPTTFALDGAEMIAAEERLDELGDEVIGVWHSHPTSQAIPSETDLSDAKQYDPNGVFVHVIVSMQGFAPIVSAYSYREDARHPLRKYWLVRLGS